LRSKKIKRKLLLDVGAFMYFLGATGIETAKEIANQ